MIRRERFPIYIWPIAPGARQGYERLQVYWCPDCGLVQLDIFDDEFIQGLYAREVFGLVSSVESPVVSSRNNAFLHYCARILGDGWAAEKRILDVGGYDVLAVQDRGFTEGVVCDPNAPAAKVGGKVTVYNEFFSRKLFDQGHFDAVILKHIVEHINDLNLFMGDVRYVLKEGGMILMEVPGLASGMDAGAYSLFYHQHLMYFDEHSLRNLMKRFGFSLVDAAVVGGNIRLVASKDKAAVAPASPWGKDPALPEKFRSYCSRIEQYFDGLEQFLDREARSSRDVLYAAGGGTTILLNLRPALKERFEAVFDSARSKIGRKIGGTDFIVQDQESLAGYQGRNIVINSEEFFQEILSAIKQKYPRQGFTYLRIGPNFEKVV
jgi:SAM-dependent methyltransferase